MSSSEPNDLDEFEIIDVQSIPTTIVYGENISGKQFSPNVKLACHEMTQLKDLIDYKINKDKIKIDNKSTQYSVEESVGHKLKKDNSKLSNISVSVEKVGEQILVKVWPCDLSGVGGHSVRQKMIKNLVEQALKDAGDGYNNFNFTNVNVSACVGVRGRCQMVKSLAMNLFFSNNRNNSGSHMNAYVKTSTEDNLTHWEPRQGPQRFFNDTICAMVTSVSTSLFEKGIRDGSIKNSVDATKDILKSPSLKKIFDDMLKQLQGKIKYLIDSVKSSETNSAPVVNNIK